MLEVERDGDVLVATWRDGENRINMDSVAALESLLARVEQTEGPCALVLTGDSKFFSNGLDLDRFGENPEELTATVRRFCVLLGRLFVLPAYTVAAINGHAFAAVAMLACAFDHRVMREDRGYWCLNEVEIGLPLPGPLAEVVFARLPRAAAVEAMLTARRYGGREALAAGIVEEVAPLSEVLPTAVARASAATRGHRAVLAEHKRLAHGGVAAVLGFEPPAGPGASR